MIGAWDAPKGKSRRDQALFGIAIYESWIVQSTHDKMILFHIMTWLEVNKTPYIPLLDIIVASDAI